MIFPKSPDTQDTVDSLFQFLSFRHLYIFRTQNNLAVKIDDCWVPETTLPLGFSVSPPRTQSALDWSHEKQIFNKQIWSIHSLSYCFVTVLKRISLLDPSHKTTISKLKLSSGWKEVIYFQRTLIFSQGVVTLNMALQSLKQGPQLEQLQNIYT